jgi:hypothetical protein
MAGHSRKATSYALKISTISEDWEGASLCLSLGPDEIHEDDAAIALTRIRVELGSGEPREGKINIVADRDGLLRSDALLAFNMLGDVMCATRRQRDCEEGSVVAGTRAIPLVVKRGMIEEAILIGERARSSGAPIVEVKELRKPKTGIVITGNEVYHGRIRDAFAPVITKKIEEFGGDVVGIYYAPDDAVFIEQNCVSSLILVRISSSPRAECPWTPMM